MYSPIVAGARLSGVQGCSLHCIGCHRPQPAYFLMVKEGAHASGTCIIRTLSSILVREADATEKSLRRIWRELFSRRVERTLANQLSTDARQV